MAKVERTCYLEQDQKPIETGSKAFGLEYSKTFNEGEIKNDIVSYLGEYRFRLPKYHYQLVFSEGKLKSSFGDESMFVKAQRSIEKNRRLGDPTRREEAELEGITSLESQLKFSQNGDTVIWASPPGPREEGYGNYGFVYLGKVEKDYRQNINLLMTAIRVENPSIGKFNKAFRSLVYGSLNDQSVGFQTAEQFLRNPVVISKNLDPKYVDGVLKEIFEFKPDEKEQKRFNCLVTRMRSLINDLIDIVKTGDSEEKIKAFYALENCFIRFEEESRNQTEVIIYSESDKKLRDIIPYYSYQPPVVVGSCGSTSSTRSNNIFNNNFQSLMEAIFGEDEWFTCPKCYYKADGPVGGKCPNCGLTKEEYAKLGNKVC